MGTNSTKFDKESHYAAKTVTQLQAELEQFRAGLAKLKGDRLFQRTTAVPWYETHIEYLRMKIAERIGNEKQ